MTKGFLFLTSFQYPTHHAHPHHALLMAHEFNALLPGRFQLVVSSSTSDVLTVPHVQTAGPFAPVLQVLRLRSAYYAIWLPLYLACFPQFRGSGAVLFVNDIRLGHIAAFWKRVFSYRLIVEVHTTVKSKTVRRALLRQTDLFVFLTEGLHARTLAGVLPHPTSVVLGNAVDVKRFEVVQSKEEIRAQLSLPVQATLIGYVGRFRPGGIDKGVEFIVSSLALLPSTVHAVLVGGTLQEMEDISRLAAEHNVSTRVHMHKRVDDVERWCAACDILAYVPGELHTNFLQYETSPMKLFEYMAARRPIIVTDAPTVRSIVSEREAHIITSGDQGAFVKTIEYIVAHPEDSEARAHAAAEKVRTLTWHARAKTILTSI